MEVTFICNCGVCNSLLVEIGGVYILCNIPCDVERLFPNDETKSILGPNGKIHCIIATTAQGLENVEALRELCDLSTTHILCTRPIYTLACIFTRQVLKSQKYHGDVEISGNKVKYNSYVINRVLHHQLKVEKQFNKDSNDVPPYLQCEQFLNNNLLHAISFKEVSQLSIEVDVEFACLKSLVNVDFVATASGFSFGSSNWYITCCGYTIAIYGESTNPMVPTIYKPFDSTLMESANYNIISPGATCQPKFQTTSKSEEIKFETYSEPAQQLEYTVQLITIANAAIDGILQGEVVIIPVDPFGNVTFAIIEHLIIAMEKRLRQHQMVRIYCLGDCMQDLFNFGTKSAEWVHPERGECAMHHENPTSPFPMLEKIKESNKLFIGNSLNDLKTVYRMPCVMLVTSFFQSNCMEFLKQKISDPNVNFIWISNRLKQMVLGHARPFAKMINVFLEPRMTFDALCNMISNTRTILVPQPLEAAAISRMQTHPATFKIGNNINVSIPLPKGLIKTSLLLSQFENVVLPNLKSIPGSSCKVAPLQIQSQVAQDMVLVSNDSCKRNVPVMFGTFTVNQVVKQLQQEGLRNEINVTKSNQYPFVIHIPERNIVIIMESPQHTIIEANNDDDRQFATQLILNFLTLI
ncbi:bifunctional Ribonuclease Z-Hydroxyacylglutathione hydrolase-like/Integrator complex subunit 9 [Babesia duncani]|uniref:Bifunctional Ribonuclease Z-Hydroxyacylglutathione hydrolase-like/Integrator complex subunit 9 n=1 Tax=Babesia duncani TaxID=323732 RepID=A0AAD9PMR8_9APIC|nr:bifunctional Ribonuclease Z-Hydroxyacylglutathione hydrolase-like/Integrator complex subunit 9 [Babesia duncani]